MLEMDQLVVGVNLRVPIEGEKIAQLLWTCFNPLNDNGIEARAHEDFKEVRVKANDLPHCDEEVEIFPKVVHFTLPDYAVWVHYPKFAKEDILIRERHIIEGLKKWAMSYPYSYMQVVQGFALFDHLYEAALEVILKEAQKNPSYLASYTRK